MGDPWGKKKSIEKSCILGGRERWYRNQFYQTLKVEVWWQQGHHENSGQHGHIRDSQLFLQTDVGSPFSPSPATRTVWLQEGVAAPTTVQKHSLHNTAVGTDSGAVVDWFADWETQFQQLLWSYLDLCPPASFFSCKTTLYLNGRRHGGCLKHVDLRFSTFYILWHT